MTPYCSGVWTPFLVSAYHFVCVKGGLLWITYMEPTSCQDDHRNTLSPSGPHMALCPNGVSIFWFHPPLRPVALSHVNFGIMQSCLSDITTDWALYLNAGYHLIPLIEFHGLSVANHYHRRWRQWLIRPIYYGDCDRLQVLITPQ